MGFFGNLFDVGERRIFDRARIVIKHSQKANSLLFYIIKGSKEINEMKRIEQESDDEVFNISNSITSGAIAPNLIDDMLKFVSREDRIVDNIYILSKAFLRYQIRDKKELAFVRAKMISANKLTSDALALLYKMHTADKLENVRKLRREVERVEEEGDEIRDAMLTHVYQTKMDYKTFYHITSLAYLMDDVLDSCEDASDIYMSIMLSILS